MDERDRAIRAVAEELHLREQYGSEPDPEVLVRCVLDVDERDDSGYTAALARRVCYLAEPTPTEVRP